jgi:hypothetical protein
MLATELGMMPCQALGVLEALWHTTAELAPSGNIGRLPNQAIAMEMFYEGDAEVLVAALIKSRHLEEHPEYRLIVHDWTQHVDHNTKRKVERRGQSMIANDGSSQVMTRHKSIPVPEPVPEPVPVPVPVKKEQKPSRDKREGDPRHSEFKAEIERYANQKGVLFVWDASEAKQLDLLLKSAPQLKLEGFQRCLLHRARSPGTPHGERPRAWLPNILKYQEAPLNEFGKTGAGNGTVQGNSKSNPAIERQRVTHDAIRAAALRRYGNVLAGDDGGSTGVQAQSGASSGNAGCVPEGMGGVGSEIRADDFQGRTLEGTP